MVQKQQKMPIKTLQKRQPMRQQWMKHFNEVAKQYNLSAGAINYLKTLFEGSNQAIEAQFEVFSEKLTSFGFD